MEVKRLISPLAYLQTVKEVEQKRQVNYDSKWVNFFMLEIINICCNWKG